MPKIETKNALLGYIGLEFENNIVILKSTPSNFPNCKIS